MKHLILGILFPFLASNAIAQTDTDWQKLVTWTGSGYEVEGATKIDAGAAKMLHDRGVTFIDARTEGEWKRGHIPGASNLYDVTEAALTEIVDKDGEVVFYCASMTCRLSPTACARALNWGYKNVYYFAEGYPGWKAAGYLIEKAE